MPIQEYENVKGFTFIQSTEPAESKSKEHDTWYNTSNNKVYMFQNYRWKMYVNAIYFPGADYGYVCGGHDGSNLLSNIDRFSFPFDSGTSSLVGNMSESRRAFSGCNSSNYSYLFGNYVESNIDRFSFPFDSGASSLVGNLSQIKGYTSSCNSSNYGYVTSGYGSSSGNVYYSTIDRITFPFDSGTASHIGNLSQTKYATAACNSSKYGYVCGAEIDESAESFSTVDRITFPFDSGTASHVGNLSSKRGYISGCNSSNYGYTFGGQTYSTQYDYHSYIDRFSFPFDSGTATHVGNLNYTKIVVATNNSSNYGYCCGGSVSGAQFSIIDRIAFPFDSGTATHVGNLSKTRSNSSATDGTDFITLFDNLSSRVYV